MKNLKIQGITEMGCCVYATLQVSNDYTMNEVISEVKRRRFIKFRLIDSMKVFVDVK